MLLTLVLAQAIFQPLPAQPPALDDDLRPYPLVYEIQTKEAVELQAQITLMEQQLKTLLAPLEAHQASYQRLADAYLQRQTQHKRIQMHLYRTPPQHHEKLMGKLKALEAEAEPIYSDLSKVALDWGYEFKARRAQIEALAGEIVAAARALAILTGRQNTLGFAVDVLMGRLSAAGAAGWVDLKGLSLDQLRERVSIALATGRLLKPQIDALRFLNEIQDPPPSAPAAWAPVQPLITALLAAPGQSHLHLR